MKGTHIKSIEKSNNNLQRMRAKRGMSQKQLAEVSGVHIRVIQKAEITTANSVSAVRVWKLAKALHCLIEDLLDEETETEESPE